MTKKERIIYKLKLTCQELKYNRNRLQEEIKDPKNSSLFILHFARQNKVIIESLEKQMFDLIEKL